MKLKKVLLIVLSTALVGVSSQAGTSEVLGQGFNIGFNASDFYTTNGTTFSSRFVNVTASPNGGLSGTEGDGYSFLGVNNSADGILSLLGRGSVDLETILAAGQTYTFSGDFAWRYPSAVDVQDDLFMGSGSGFRIDGAIQPVSQVDFEFSAIGAQNTWSEYTFSYTTVASDVGKEITLSIDILDRDLIAGSTQLLTDNWNVTSNDDLNLEFETLSGNTNLAISWPSQREYYYSVEASSNLVEGGWMLASGNLTNAALTSYMAGIIGTGDAIAVTTSINQAQSFYRVIAGIDSNLIENEAVVFCSDLQPLSAQLLFKPTEILSVQRANRSQFFEEGTDYTITTNGLISLTPASRIPVLDYYAVATDPTFYRFTDIYGTPFYSPGGTRKHTDYDVVVTYTYDQTEESLDDLATGHWESKLTNVLDQLHMKQSVNVTFFGDSITFGAQASSLAPGATPFAPAYPMQVVEALKFQFGYDQINYANKAVGGTTSDWGLQEIQQVIDTAPDLVVLAFGMNDAGAVPTARYKQNTESMIQALRTANPSVSIVLLAEFSPNPEWAGANCSIRAVNRTSLYDLYSTYENMGFVDIGAVSRQIAGRKKFQDFSGNNINHPNDFLHQIYADLILNVFE